LIGLSAFISLSISDMLTLWAVHNYVTHMADGSVLESDTELSVQDSRSSGV